MSKPLVEFQRVEKELYDSIEQLEKFVEDQFILVKEIRSIHLKFQQQRPFLKKDVPAVEKSIFRRTFKLLRRAGRVQRHLTSTSSKLREQLQQLELILPSKIKDKLTSLEFPSKIEIYSRVLLRYLSRKDGLLLKTLKNSLERSAEVIFFNAEEVLEKGIGPLEGSLRLLKDFLTKNKTAMEVAVVAEHTFILNLEPITDRFQGVGEPVILLDANFARAFEVERISREKDYFNLALGRARLIIPRKVLKEMTHRPRWSATALVPKELVHYLQSLPRMEIIDVDPTPEEKNNITEIWKRTAKGRREKEEDFRNSGDMELLVYAQRNAEIEPVVILSNDNDIIKVAPYLPGRIGVYSYVKSSLVRAH